MQSCFEEDDDENAQQHAMLSTLSPPLFHPANLSNPTPTHYQVTPAPLKLTHKAEVFHPQQRILSPVQQQQHHTHSSVENGYSSYHSQTSSSRLATCMSPPPQPPTSTSLANRLLANTPHTPSAAYMGKDYGWAMTNSFKLNTPADGRVVVAQPTPPPSASKLEVPAASASTSFYDPLFSSSSAAVVPDEQQLIVKGFNNRYAMILQLCM